MATKRVGTSSSTGWPSGRRGSVLIVDDDPMVLQVTAAVLKSAGFEVEVRDSALGTTAAIFQSHPAIVLLDLEMPALNGVHIARLLREKNLKTAVILYSGRPLIELERMADECGAAGAIEKTHDTDQFLAQFRHIVRSLGL